MAVIMRRIGDASLDGDVDVITAIVLSLLLDADMGASAKQRTVDYFSSFVNKEAATLIAVTLKFLESFSKEAMQIWIIGFIGEAAAEGSCHPGALERILTGLRGIGDSELDAIFSQVESPKLCTMYLSTNFNIFSGSESRKQTNCAALARELVDRNVDVSAEEMEKLVVDTLTLYGRGIASNYGVDTDAFRPTIRAIVETVGDSYDVLKPFVVTELAERAVRLSAKKVDELVVPLESSGISLAPLEPLPC